MDAWNCEKNWAKRIPTGLQGWTCFGLERSQYVPFWLGVAALTLGFIALVWIREHVAGQSDSRTKTSRRKAADKSFVGAFAQRFSSIANYLASLPAAQGKLEEVEPLHRSTKAGHDEVTDYGSCEAGELRINTDAMAKVCTDRRVGRGLEAASLAVLLAMKRRRNYSSVSAGIARKGRGGMLQEVGVELELPKMSFADFAIAVDKALQAQGRSSSAACTEAPELIFAWDQELPEAAGQWVVRPVARNSMSVLGPSTEEERCYQIFFEACAKEPERNLWELPMSSEASLQVVLSWGTPAKDFASYRDPSNQRLVPVTRLLAGPFANPKADAVAGNGFCISYEELFSRASIVQQVVLNTASHTATRTAVLFMPRGEAIASAFLGALKAGFQVVPVDVHWPGDRAVTVAEDSAAVVVLVDPSSAQAWQALGLSLPVICVDDALFKSGSKAVASAPVDQEDPAMVLYTSGSTGKPKGIVLSHGYLTSLAAGVSEWKRMGTKTRALCYHSPTWMPFIDYLFAPLLKGGCCLYFPDTGSHVIRPSELKDFANKHSASNAGFVPAMLDILQEDGLPKDMTDIGVGGAAVPADLCRKVLAALPEGGVLYTGYSGTELGDVTAIAMRTAEDVERGATDKGFMGAGRSHSGQRVAILDEGFSPVGPGAIGEVSVAGPGLASGYLKLPEKTAETFLTSLSALGCARAARSGDLAIWTEAGNLQVVGRRDAMVKVRGARVELGEVESAVLSHPGVKAAVVTVHDDRLVAYVVPAVPANLRDHCKERLVAYMVPHLFEGLEELPRLPNGKVNKKALPKPEMRTDGAETVMELDSLGMMRKFTRKATSEDRVLDNVRAILIAVVIHAHAIPLLPVGAAMLDVASRPMNANWGPIQLYVLQITRGGGWSSLAFLNGFDDTRAMQPYGLTYREPLFLILWLLLDFNWSMWYLPAFVLMRAGFCAAHHVGIEKTHIILASQLWILLPVFLDLYIGWQPQSPGIPDVCPSGCFCLWQEWPWAQTVAYYTVGWWVSSGDSESPAANSMMGRAMIFIPCYWIGFYSGGSIFTLLTKVADEPSMWRRAAIAGTVLALYCTMYTQGQTVLNGYDDRCSSFWGANGLVYQQIFKNIAYFAMNLSMSLTYVVFIAAAVPVHLKYLAKICFSSLIFSAFTPCLLDFPAMCLELRKVLPAAISPGLEIGWTFSVAFLYELVVGAFFAVVLPIIAKPVMQAADAFKAKA